MFTDEVMMFIGDKIFEWGCFFYSGNEVGHGQVDHSPPLACPDRCYLNTNCTHCLKSSGAEGGSKECIWSELLHEVGVVS